jgi:hypothetical protein
MAAAKSEQARCHARRCAISRTSRGAGAAATSRPLVRRRPSGEPRHPAPRAAADEVRELPRLFRGSPVAPLPVARPAQGRVSVQEQMEHAGGSIRRVGE